MVLMIKPLTPNKKVYLEKLDNYLIIDSICKIDKNKIYQLYLIDDVINDYGLLNKSEILLDELLLTLNIEAIYTKDIDEIQLNKYTDYYGVKVYSL